MAEAYLGEIRIFAGTFAPRHWALCQGQIVPIVNNEALFSLIGTTYGGDGRTTFALPDFRGRIPVGDGTGVGLTPRPQGVAYGTETATLTMNNMPTHKHSWQASTNGATSSSASGKVLANTSPNLLYEEIDQDETIEALQNDCVQDSGKNMPHNNMMPSMGLNFIICLKGTFPQRN